jgi:hypothetical protein
MVFYSFLSFDACLSSYACVHLLIMLVFQGGTHHDVEEYQGGSYVTHLIAGAIAGTAEHCGMFPIDTIKVCVFIISSSEVVTCGDV